MSLDDVTLFSANDNDANHYDADPSKFHNNTTSIECSGQNGGEHIGREADCVTKNLVSEIYLVRLRIVSPSITPDMTSESPITQVPETTSPHLGHGGDQDQLIYQQQPGNPTDQANNSFPNKLKLDLRGTRLDIDRDTLVSLPESLLIVMFPNGLILGRVHDDEYDDDEDEGSNDSVALEDQVNYVDFDPKCLDFVLQYYRHAQQVFAEEHSGDNNSFQQGASSMPMMNPNQHPLLTKQAIIVLREELEYFALPPSAKEKGTSPATNESMRKLKLDCGKYLLERDQIFTALQRNISKENNVAEQHLIDMLCDSGFSREDKWGYRAMEPLKTCIVSIALVMLKTTGPENHMATAQKLLLFWRKPARKCWWDGNAVEINNESIRLWARRTWTLELALV